MQLDTLLQRPDLWRGGQPPSAAHPTLATGHATLDSALGGGWPLGAVSELLTDHSGIGELSLLLPSLARLTRSGRWVIFIAPPHIPYAPALAQAGLDLSHVVVAECKSEREMLWALEQSLRSGVCGAALGWLQKVEFVALRRLQLAAEAGRAAALIYRPHSAQHHPSPAALRLVLRAQADALELHLIKRRGSSRDRLITLPRWPRPG